MCIKGQQIIDHVYHKDRLKHPLKKENGGWKRISWDEALDAIATRLIEGREKYGPTSLDVQDKEGVTFILAKGLIYET